MALCQAAFEEAVRLHGPVLRRILCRMTCGREADADDLLQRTFERAWAKRHTFDGDDPGPWLHGIARFEYLAYLRCQQRFLRLRQAFGDAERHLGAADASDTEPDVEALEHCLGRLRPVDRYIVDRFYGRTEPAPGQPADPPMTDAEIAAALNGHPSWRTRNPWKGDRVRKRRHRALARIRQCVERRERAGRTAVQPVSRRPMMERTTSERATLSPETLLRYLEAPDSPDQAPVRARLEACEADRHNLEALVALESALVKPWWDRATAEADEACSPLPSGLEARLLSIPARMPNADQDTTGATDGGISRQPELRVLPRPGPDGGDPDADGSTMQTLPRRRRAWRPIAAMAAVFLAGIATWHWYATVPGGPEGATEPVRWKGGDEEANLAAAPVVLWVQLPGDEAARVIDLQPDHDGLVETRLPANARIQVRVTRPERLPAGKDGWSARMKLYAAGDGGERRLLPIPPVTGRAVATDADLLLGGTLNLAALERHGIGPGDSLEMEIVRDAAEYHVEIHIVEPRGGGDP